MKKEPKRLLASVLAVTLVVSQHTCTVSAMDYQTEDIYIMVDNDMVTEDYTGDIQLEIPAAEELTDVDKMAADKKITLDHLAETGEYIAADPAVAVAVESAASADTGTTTASAIYYGTVSGNLTSANEYVLYPATLAPGDYLQARLAQPNDPQIDYDLLLFDSSLALIKSSDYVTYVNDNGTLNESVGYIAASDETIYVCVYSIAGGSATEKYTMDYTITTNFAEADEPNEHAKEAAALVLGETGIVTNGRLNSPIDNDWYSFTVLDSPDYNKMRLSVSSSSSVNGCRFELYRNLVTSNYYGMQYLGTGTGGEVELPAGTYYLRIVSTNTFNNFDQTDVPTYNLSVVQVARVDMIKITDIRASGGNYVSYNEGELYRVQQEITQRVLVKGVAYYLDERNISRYAKNVHIKAEIKDKQWAQINRPDMAYVYSADVTNSEGSFSLHFYLNTALGLLSYRAPVSMHYYDVMQVTVYPADDDMIRDYRDFYYLKFSDFIGIP